ncbi:hypothetical protein AML91_00010, partial [Paenibacillus jilunlii]
ITEGLHRIQKVLTVASQDYHKKIYAEHAQQNLNKHDQARITTEFYFPDKIKQQDLETIFLIGLKEGNATVLTADHGDKLKPDESIKVQPAMEHAAQG